jgi:hypothetical protein
MYEQGLQGLQGYEARAYPQVDTRHGQQSGQPLQGP